MDEPAGRAGTIGTEVHRNIAERLVLPVGIEPTTSPLPRAGSSRKRLKTLALADGDARNVP